MATTPTPLASRLKKRLLDTSPLVIGLDPDFRLLPACLQPGSASPGEVTRALFEVCKLTLKAAAPHACAVKFQSAHFEQFGLPGLLALADGIAFAKRLGLVTIMDAKRGDIASTAAAYARAWLNPMVSFPSGLSVPNPQACDFLTVNPFLGEDSVEPFLEECQAHNAGLFLLVKTSNPGSGYLQNLALEGGMGKVYERIGASVCAWGQKALVGAVVGATHEVEAKALRALMPHTIFLMPGLGAQGGQLSTIGAAMSPEGDVLVPVSRGLLPDPKGATTPQAFASAVASAAEGYASELKALLESRRAH